MRTTLNIDDDLYRQAKASAALRGVSVTSVVEEALRAALLRVTPDPVDLPPLPVLPQSGGLLLADVDLTDNRQLYALMYDEDDRRYGPGGQFGPR